MKGLNLCKLLVNTMCFREFGRGSVLENLDLLLNHEVEKGNFIRVDAENYIVVSRPRLNQVTMKCPFTTLRTFPQLPQYPILPSSMSQESTFMHSLPTSPLPPHQVHTFKIMSFDGLCSFRLTKLKTYPWGCQFE